MPQTETMNMRVSVERLLAQVNTIAPVLKRGARESETSRRLAEDSVSSLLDGGYFRLCCPEVLGGAEASLADGIAVIEAVAEVDTTAAWNLGVGATSNGFAGAYLSDDAVLAIFADDRTIIAGQMAPIGAARRVDGGLLVSGRWSFGSGIRQANWVLGGATLRDGAQAIPVVVFAPVAQATVDAESWQVMGLAGTGSCDYSLDQVFVPDGYWFSFPAPRKLRGGDVFEPPVVAQVMLLHAGFALGAGRSSLSEITSLAREKARAFTSGTVAQTTTFQRELAEARARVSASRLYVYDVARRMQDAVGTAEFNGLMLEGRAASRYATDVALDVATWAYRRGGGTTLRLEHPLQRVMRDLLAATQHVYVDETAYIALGTHLIGAPA